MPIKDFFDKNEEWLKPTQRWKQLDITTPFTKFKVDHNFYATSFNLIGENKSNEK